MQFFSLFSSLDYGWAKLMSGLQNGFLNGFFKYYSVLFDKGLIILAAAMALVLFKRTRRLALNMALCVMVAFAISLVLKTSFDRPRPFADTASDYYTWWVAAGSNKASNTGSFPSGHATVAFSFAVALIVSLNKKYGWIGFLFAFLAGVARTYLMVHYLSDVLMGLVVGLVGGALGALLTRFLFNFADKHKDKKFFAFCLDFSVVNLFKKSPDEQ